MILGIDIGGTNVKFGVCDDSYNIIKSYSIKTLKDKGDMAFLESICEKVNEIKEEFPIEKIGMGSPGTIDTVNGIGIRAANLPYSNTPITETVERLTGIPVSIGNDATCAIAGELYAGCGKEYRNFAMITLGTGVGGGIVIDRKIYNGKTGVVAEFGHFSIKYDGLPCPCGQKGCFEQYASVTALIRQTKEAIEKNPDSLLAKLGKEKVSGRTSFDAMKAGCPVGAQVVDKYIDYLAVGVMGIRFFLEPDVLVIGGAISNEGDYLIKPLKEKLIREIDVKVSELGNSAGIIGAVAIAKENL